MLILAALCAGGFATTAILWFAGIGGNGATATARLSRLRDTNLPDAEEHKVNLRRRGSVNFAGMTVISGNLAANWSRDLERAGLALNAKEFLVVRAVVSAVLVMAGLLFLPLPFLALGGIPLGFWATGFWLKRRINSRLHKMESQLVELLQMLASGLRAGFGLVQALETSAEQLPAPLSVELRRTLRDTAMGASIEQALTSLNERVGSADFDIVITAVMIQRAVGGNLAEILDNVAHTMRERERIRGEIRTLTSQQRLTGYVIGGIPIGLLVVFYIISPDFTGLLFTEKLGQMMLAGAAVSEFIGFMVIKKIVNIEI